MRSSAGSELLARCRIVGTPGAGIPRNTVSMKPGPNLALKIWMHFWAHCGVAALADSVPAVLRPPARASVAAAASTLLLMDMNSSLLESQPYRAHGGCAGHWITVALIRTGTDVP